MNARTYNYDIERRVWRTHEHDTFAYSDGDEIERRLLGILQQSDDLSSTSSELRQHIVDWPSEYHFSPLRHALLRPFAISRSTLFLELGCGCGAITRYLGETGATVVAVEGSLLRAQIAAERCRDLPNVSIYCDNLADFFSTQRFDFVSLVGVLEYAPLFVPGSDPIDRCLSIVRGFLAPRGQLIVAIENQLGLKYFNGCREDHLGKRYFGVHDLYAESQPRTFGKQELSDRMETAGFLQQEFFYPFPDYKLPQIILSDQGIRDRELRPADLLRRTTSRDDSGEWLPNFHENMVWEALARNDLLADMANSFLVLAGPAMPADAQRQPDGWLASAYSLGRMAAYATETRFLRSGDAISVCKHLVTTKCADSNSRDFVLHEPADTVPYVHGELYLRKLQILLARGGALDELAKWAKPWVDTLHAASDRGSTEGLLPEDWLDAIPANFIMNGEGRLELIDVEWRSLGPVPLVWVLVRGLINSVTSSPYSRALAGLNFRQLIDNCLRLLDRRPPDDDAYGRAAELEDRLAMMVYGPTRGTPRLAELLVLPVFSYCSPSTTLKDENRSLKDGMAAMHASRSWRITAPLRVADQWLRRLP